MVDLEDMAVIAAGSSDLFRLEVLPTYLVAQEDLDFTAWKHGSRALPTPETNSWLAHIRDTTAAGACWSRVRVLDYPLSEYSEFELHGYQANAAAGETIHVADRAWSPELDGLRVDFWVFDTTVIRMIYDEAGHLVGPKPADDPGPYLGMRAVALRHAIPLAEFLADHEPRLIA